MPQWLVTIDTKPWVHGKAHTLDYIQVDADSEGYALHIAFIQFMVNCKYESATKKMMAHQRLSMFMVFAHEAIQIGE